MNHRFLFLTLALIGAATIPLPATPNHGHGHGLQVRVLAAGGSGTAHPPKLAVLSPEGKAAPLEFLRFNVSLPVLQKKAEALRVYRLDDLNTLLADPQAAITPVLEFPVPPGAERLLVVAEADTQGAWTYRAFAEDARDFPGGSRLILNLTRAPLSGYTGDTRFAVPALESGIVKPSKIGGEALRQNVQIFASVKGKSLPVASTRWTFHPDQRGIVVVFADPGLAKFRCIVIPDNVPVGSLSAR